MADIPTNAKSEGEILGSLEHDPFPNERGVLLSDKIERYVSSHSIIDPFDEDCLEPAGYQMRVGQSYYHGPDKKLLSEGDTLVIKPYDVVVIETAERVRIPRFMIARWNIKVKLAYKGLLWVGAAQVDPGYVGYLSCPIYNLSTRTVQLRKGDKLALIDFVKTTPYDEDTCQPFPSMPPRGIGDVASGGLESALSEYKERVESELSKYKERVDDAKRAADEAKAQSTYFSVLVITVLSILFAVLVGSEAGLGVNWGWLKYLGIIVIALSFSLSLLALYLSWRSGKRPRRERSNR